MLVGVVLMFKGDTEVGASVGVLGGGYADNGLLTGLLMVGNVLKSRKPNSIRLPMANIANELRMMFTMCFIFSLRVLMDS